jgi:hypothetical protein
MCCIRARRAYIEEPRVAVMQQLGRVVAEVAGSSRDQGIEPAFGPSRSERARSRQPRAPARGRIGQRRPSFECEVVELSFLHDRAALAGRSGIPCGCIGAYRDDRIGGRFRELGQILAGGTIDPIERIADWVRKRLVNYQSALPENVTSPAQRKINTPKRVRMFELSHAQSPTRRADHDPIPHPTQPILSGILLGCRLDS